MDVGRARTWPNISMISNRLRIENAIHRARAAIRKPSRQARQEAKQAPPVTVSDDASGSGDEVRFLAAGHHRRASMPDGTGAFLEEKEWRKDRRRFLAQFSDRRDVMGGKEIVAQAREYDLETDDDDDDEM